MNISAAVGLLPGIHWLKEGKRVKKSISVRMCLLLIMQTQDSLDGVLADDLHFHKYILGRQEGSKTYSSHKRRLEMEYSSRCNKLDVPFPGGHCQSD